VRNVPDYRCHSCKQQFFAEVENDYGTYEFKRCPHCGSAKTTLA
jgi:DNA-directed RNA polymerase subunit RPC12/RpoP